MYQLPPMTKSCTWCLITERVGGRSGAVSTHGDIDSAGCPDKDKKKWLEIVFVALDNSGRRRAALCSSAPKKKNPHCESVSALCPVLAVYLLNQYVGIYIFIRYY